MHIQYLCSPDGGDSCTQVLLAWDWWKILLIASLGPSDQFEKSTNS